MAKIEKDELVEYTTLILSLEEGDREFAIIKELSVDGQTYVALSPFVGADEVSDDIYFYRYDIEDGEPTLGVIPDDADDEFEAVADAYDEWLDEVMFDQMSE